MFFKMILLSASIIIINGIFNTIPSLTFTVPTVDHHVDRDTYPCCMTIESVSN